MRLPLALIAIGGVALAVIGFAMAVVHRAAPVPWLVLGAGGVIDATCLFLLARHWAQGTVFDQKSAVLLLLPLGMLIMTWVAFSLL